MLWKLHFPPKRPGPGPGPINFPPAIDAIMAALTTHTLSYMFLDKSLGQQVRDLMERNIAETARNLSKLHAKTAEVRATRPPSATLAAVGFEAKIKPYFTACYREHMQFMFDLWSIDDVKANWDAINDSVKSKRMPRAGCPEGVWNDDQRNQFLADFQAWKDGGFQP